MWSRISIAVGGVAAADALRCAKIVKAEVCQRQRNPECASFTWQGARKSGLVDEIPKELVRALQNGTCVAMVGAGLSYPARLPGWEQLLNEVASSAGVELKLPEAGSYDDMDQVQFQLAALVGKDRVCSVFKSRLFIEPPFPDAMQAVLKVFCRVPFCAIVSWNWDNILDSSYRNTPAGRVGYQSILSSKVVPTNYNIANVPLLKMQGDLADPSSFVLTKEDYDRRACEGDPFLRQLHESRTVLYIGLGLRGGGVGDEKRAGSLHYAIINDVSPERRQELRENYNIHAISYDSKATQWMGAQLLMEELTWQVYQT